MKTNFAIHGSGMIRGSPGGQYYKTWANYFVKFLNEYKKRGVEFWGLTTGNEPMTGFVPFYPFNSLGFTPELQRDFMKLDLGPTLAAAGYGADKLNVMIMDHNREFLPRWSDVVLSDPDAAKYVAGTAVHWYSNWATNSTVLDQVHDHHPDHFLLSTEACVAPVALGRWEGAEDYAYYIMDDLLHWTTGWVSISRNQTIVQ